MLSSALSTLLDEARAEAKRYGHPGVTPLHLAATLARREPAAFEEAFGFGSAALLRERLLREIPSGDEQDTIAILEAAGSDDPVAVIVELKKSLGDLKLASGGLPHTGDGAPLQAPSAPSNMPPRPLLGGLLQRVAPDRSIIGFEPLLNELVALLSMRTPAVPLVHGSNGAGKSSVPVALATHLANPGYTGPLADSRVTRVNTSAVLSEDPNAALDRALDSQEQDEIVAVDDIESLLSLGSAAIILPMLARLRGAASDPSRKVLLLVDEAYVSRLEAIDQELVGLTTPVEVPALGVEVLWDIARAKAAELAAHHGVELSDDVAREAASPPSTLDRRVHPGLLIGRLDRACARTAMRGEKQVREADLGLAATPEVAPLDAARLIEKLRARVRGQDEALAPVAARLSLTRAQLDLRPVRPDGVFLFVGPTGVGKTELARALCAELFGDDERLVRLDMSEYAEEWALSRLIGPQPGYVGFTEPEAWLTTRIRKQPETVLLLDEIEKAHPGVWNAFLQVFDAGRLTDARGNVAVFERTVIAMTSNLGSESFGSAPVGFSQPQDDQALARRDQQRVLEAVKRAMPPELINRLDELIVFQALSREAIAEIAALELERLRGRLAQRGYLITVGSGVAELVAETGYDPAFGARHLQRNIERLLLVPLASIPERDLSAEVVDGRIEWRAQGHRSSER
jgi:ATP-dependent Clp protease ATP-binding subunit ClpA